MGWSWWSLGNRPALFPVLAFVGGVAFGPLLSDGGSWWLLAAGSALALAVLLGARAGGLLFGLGAAFCLGVGLSARAAELELPPLGRPVQLEGRVERVGPHGFTLDVAEVDGVPSRFRATLSGDAAGLLVGQRVRVQSKLKLVAEAANPGEWSRAEWAWRRGEPVSGGFARERLVVRSAPSPWRRWLAREHASLLRDTYAVSPDEASAALLLTLSAGQRAELGDALEDSFARSGLAHVLSVSGLHVAVLAFTLFAALRWVASRRMRRGLRFVEPRAWAGPLSLPLVWGYVLFTGWQGPAVRSGLMCSLVLCAWLVRRRSDGLNALALAGLGMLVVDPAALFDLSVQLSFLAVLALVLLAPAVRAALPIPLPSPATQDGWRLRLARWREAAVQTFTASLAVTLTTAPLVLAAFQRVSVAGLVSNVVTLPLSGVLTVVAAAGAAVHAVWPPLSVPLLWSGAWLAKLFVGIADGFAALPFATASLPAATLPVMLGWWAGLGALVFARGRWQLVGLLAPAALALHLASPPLDERLQVTFLAVGHGDAIVLSSRGQHALVDGGGVPQGHDTGRKFVLPFLRQRRIERLALTVLSHAHPDHALGLISTLAEVPTERLWLPAGVSEGPLVQELLDAADEAQVDEQEAGATSWWLGAARVDVLGPPKDRSWVESENDRSLVLLVTHGEVTFLLTGDLESAGEAALDVGRVTVVKAPHHGSDTSSTPELVDKTRPRHVVFCVGKNNRFRFPRAEVVERWSASGARCHRTDVDGAITFTSDGKDVSVETFKPVERRARKVFPLRAREKWTGLSELVEDGPTKD